MYLVKWKHWPSSFNTWEPLSNLVGCENAIAQYHSQQEGQSSTTVFPLKRKIDDGLNTDSSSDSDDDMQDDRQVRI